MKAIYQHEIINVDVLKETKHCAHTQYTVSGSFSNGMQVVCVVDYGIRAHAFGYSGGVFKMLDIRIIM